MEKLTKTEEPVMQLLWSLKRAFVKEVIDQLPDPKPPYNTVSSIVRILEEKGMVGHESFGRTHRYFPLVSKLDYRKQLFKNMVSDYFDGSYSALLSQIVEENALNHAEIEELKEMINQKK